MSNHLRYNSNNSLWKTIPRLADLTRSRGPNPPSLLLVRIGPRVPLPIPIHGVDFVDADLVDQLDMDKNYVVENFGCRDPRWCGLDAIHHGLTAVGLTPIGRKEVLGILARTERRLRGWE
jgi:hypothetical protein